MSVKIFPLIAEKIVADIRSGAFTERLPPCAALCARYQVARNTITLAIRKLSARGLLQPTHHGTFIVPRMLARLPENFIVLVTGKIAPDDSLLQSITAIIAAHGRALRIQTEFAVPERAAGVIFINSTFRLRFRQPLTARHIPFVVGNDCPEYFAVHCVDWQHQDEFRQCLDPLVRAGTRRIALYMRSINNYRMIMAAFIAALHDYQLHDPALETFLRRRPSSTAGFCSELLNLPHMPEALLVVGPSSQLPLLRRLLGDSVQLLRLRPKQPRLITQHRRLATALWRLLQRAIDDPRAAPVHRRIALPVDLVTDP